MAGRQPSQLFFDENLRACRRRFAASCARQRKLVNGWKRQSLSQGLPDDFMSCCSAQNKTRVECWPARQWGKLTVRPGTQPDFPEMQSFTRSE